MIPYEEWKIQSEFVKNTKLDKCHLSWDEVITEAEQIWRVEYEACKLLEQT